MEVLKDRYTITELSERLSITAHALRYYEKEFNIQIPKDSRGRRYYTPELANLMFQITNMRSEGLEIKAIKKILEAENVIVEPPPVVLDDGSMSIIPSEHDNNLTGLKQYFDEFKDQITANVSAEVGSAREHLTREINRTKLELGACVENSARRLENKLEKHFMEVDKHLSDWRERNKKSFFKRLFK